MTGQLTYLLAQERVADLQRAADQQRLVRAAKGTLPLGHRRWALARLRTGAWSRWLHRSSRATLRNAANDSRPRTDAPNAAEAQVLLRWR